MDHVRAFTITPELLSKLQRQLQLDGGATGADGGGEGSTNNNNNNNNKDDSGDDKSPPSSLPPFQQSELYSTQDQSKLVDLDVRSSRFRKWTPTNNNNNNNNRVLFDLMDDVVTACLNNNNRAYEDKNDEKKSSSSNKNDNNAMSKDNTNTTKFMLVRNDITEIHYDVGDFFDRHSDYTTITSNCVEEYTLVLCVTPSSSSTTITAAAATPKTSSKTVALETGVVAMAEKIIAEAEAEAEAESGVETKTTIVNSKPSSDVESTNEMMKSGTIYSDNDVSMYDKNEEDDDVVAAADDGLSFCQGGNTLIFPFASGAKPGGTGARTGTSKAAVEGSSRRSVDDPVPFDTKTPGCGVIFRKDMDHAGEKVLRGKKIVLVANLIGIRQTTSSQVLLVTFPSSLPSNSMTGKMDGDEMKAAVKAKTDDNGDRPNGTTALKIVDKSGGDAPCDDGTPTKKHELMVDAKKKASSTVGAKKVTQVSPREILTKVADQDGSYVLPVDVLKGTMLGDYVECVNEKAGEGNEPAVVHYQCTRFTFDEFRTVAKILQRSYVKEDDVYAHKACLDFFGPFDFNQMFVTLALDPSQGKTKADDEEAEGSNIDDTMKDPPLKKTKVESMPTQASSTTQAAAAAAATATNLANDNHPNDGSGDPLDVIVCENESRTNVVCDVARQFGLPYVPFRVLFVEGAMAFFDGDGGMVTADSCGKETIPMIPVAVMIGDYNNVFMLNWFVHRRGYAPIDRPLGELHTEANFWNKLKSASGGVVQRENAKEVIEAFRKVLDDDDCFEIVLEGSCKGETVVTFGRILKDCWDWWYDVMDCTRQGFSFGLQLAFGTDDCKEKTIRQIFDSTKKADDENLYLLPGNSQESPTSNDSNSTKTKKKALFHRDEKGLIAFSFAEAERASDFISSSSLIERIKAALNEKRFELPQERKDVESFFCNDEQYGRFNMLWVTGALLLEEKDNNAKATPGKVADESFDAWPKKSDTVDVNSFAKEIAGTYKPIRTPADFYEAFLKPSSSSS